MPDKGNSRKSVVSAEQRAINQLIKQVNETDQIRNQVPRRIWFLFAIFIVLGTCLLIFSLKFGRRDRPTRDPH